MGIPNQPTYCFDYSTYYPTTLLHNPLHNDRSSSQENVKITHDDRRFLVLDFPVCVFFLLGLVHGAARGTVLLWSLLGLVVVVFINGQSLARLGVGSHLQF